MKRLPAALLLCLVLGGTAWVAYGFLVPGQNQAARPAYRLGEVTRGDIERSVTAAGRLQALDTVNVSSQLSGQIAEVLADFNDRVRAGQAIARLDALSFDARVAEAEARLEHARAALTEAETALPGAQAQLARLQAELRRKRQLLSRGVISDRDVESAATELRVGVSNLRASQARIQVRQTEIAIAEAALQEARVQLDRTVIRAPIDGVVINRDVSPGQTVAASLQAPTLFTIARNLRRMQMNVFVDEADIGAVRLGQRVEFRVEAYPTREFGGEVQSIRRAPQTVENVTTYTVVVAVANDNHALLPGMTAIARLITAEKRGVLRVPNAALRFDPNQAGAEDRTGGQGAAQVWRVDADGGLQPVPVEPGLSDALRTEILTGALEAGERLAIGFRRTAARP